MNHLCRTHDPYNCDTCLLREAARIAYTLDYNGHNAAVMSRYGYEQQVNTWMSSERIATLRNLTVDICAGYIRYVSEDETLNTPNLPRWILTGRKVYRFLEHPLRTFQEWDYAELVTYTFSAAALLAFVWFAAVSAMGVQ